MASQSTQRTQAPPPPPPPPTGHTFSSSTSKASSARITYKERTRLPNITASFASLKDSSGKASMEKVNDWHQESRIVGDRIDDRINSLRQHAQELRESGKGLQVHTIAASKKTNSSKLDLQDLRTVLDAGKSERRLKLCHVMQRLLKTCSKEEILAGVDEVVFEMENDGETMVQEPISVPITLLEVMRDCIPGLEICEDHNVAVVIERLRGWYAQTAKSIISLDDEEDNSANEHSGQWQFIKPLQKIDVDNDLKKDEDTEDVGGNGLDFDPRMVMSQVNRSDCGSYDEPMSEEDTESIGALKEQILEQQNIVAKLQRQLDNVRTTLVRISIGVPHDETNLHDILESMACFLPPVQDNDILNPSQNCLQR